MIVCLRGRVKRFFAILVTATVLLFPLCNVAPVTAQTATAQIDNARPLADVLEEVTPAVVNISVTSGSPTENNPLYNALYFRRFFFDRPDMESQSPRMSAGSGVIVDADRGYVITNHHVVEGASEIPVTLKDRRELVGSDKATDALALFRGGARFLLVTR
jgi:S1-C subfamily serine protease